MKVSIQIAFLRITHFNPFPASLLYMLSSKNIFVPKYILKVQKEKPVNLRGEKKTTAKSFFPPISLVSTQ